MKRDVVESDFRKEEFKTAEVRDYEFRADGKIVRKDRWKRGICMLKQILIPDTGEFEIDDIIKEAKLSQRNKTENREEHF